MHRRPSRQEAFGLFGAAQAGGRPGVDLRPAPFQQADHIGMVLPQGVMDRPPAAGSNRVDLRPGIQQRFHNLPAAIPRGGVQGRPTAVIQVDLGAGVKQDPDQFQIARRGRRLAAACCPTNFR